ncbi:MAG: hydrolase [Chromatiaceae bacterium]|nr:hydrolase [Gammaproteobacteria bacterium]MCP5306866.1 hydrolase [Chromatiaceae bacterium]MCP5316169.1 hydrolase [Chromatiaceae bacterium]
MPLIHSRFRPAWWLRSAHAQTLWPALLRRRPRLQVTWERLELDDGDFLDLAWSGPDDAPIVMLFHGLQGSIHSHYAGALMHHLNRQGLRACLMHFRGCSGVPNRLPISYHSGKTDDPQRLLEHIAAVSGGPPFAAVGVSLGGNVLLKWLGEQGPASPLRRAAALSVPFRLDAAADRLQHGLSRLYQRHLVTSMQAAYRRKFSRMSSPLDVDVGRLTTFRLFDDQVTAALHGFDGVDDYYSRCSSRPFIANIRVPTLILHAQDDPFMFPDTPPASDELPENVFLELTPHGGHAGFIGGRLPGWPDYYAERRIAQWIAAD